MHIVYDIEPVAIHKKCRHVYVRVHIYAYSTECMHTTYVCLCCYPIQ